jgi:hypothetical protein
MAHFAVAFLVIGILSLVLASSWFAPLLIVPAVLSVFIVRLRTVAAVDTVTARSLLRSETVRWEDVDGLAFNKGSWARAQLKDGRELTLPAVTFSTLPQLTEASAGRVPNPYG